HGIPEFILPADFSRGRESKAGATYTYFIDQNITQKIKQLAERQNTTLFTVMFSIYIILLSRLSGQKEVVCSIISAGREHPSLYSIVGFFVNSIIYFTNVSFKTPFDNFLDKMKTDTIDLFQHQAYPLEKIFEELGLKYPDITISFNMLHIRDSAAAVEFKAAESLPFHSENYHDTKFDLEPYVTEYKNGIHINWSYKKNVFKPGTIAFIADEYIKIIDFFTNNPSKSYIEYRKQISEVKPTVQQNIQTLSIAFANQVEKIPNHIAIKVGIQHFTYAELDKYSNGIACLIQGSLKASNRNNKRIGLFFEHGYDMVASIIGTLKSGNSYVPLSVSYPLIRLSYILADSESSLILTNIKNLPTAARLAEENHIRLANVGEVKEFSPQRLDISGQSLAYILYTSGSTGNPKGVIQNHENILYYIHNWSRIFSITPEDKMTLFSSFSHDGSVQDMFGALLNGATLNVFDVKNREENAPNLSAFLIKEKITIWHSVPSLFNYFVNNIDNYGKAENFGHLRFILLGGEPLREHEMTMSAKYFPYSTLANIYGQTESSVNSIWLIPSESYKNYNGLFKIVIGKPLDNTVIVLMDEEDNILGPLETGEIMVACPHLALGYWKNEEFNQKSFFIHPTYGRMYRTGDWGRLLPDGNIEFIGRKDNQVKIRGFRIELGEIESQLLKYKGVKGSVVIFKIDEREEPNLVAYIVSENDIPQSNLREYLLAHLPDYMIPLHFIKLEKFPLTSTGKIDRKALPGPEMKNSDGYSAPRNIIEKKLVEIWEEVLGKPASMSIGIDNNFFQLGGHSLKATILTAKIHKALHVNIPLTKIFKTPTIRSLANYIKTAIKDKYLSIEPVEKKEYYPLSSAQKRLYILYQMEREGIEYNIPSISVLDGEIHIDKLERIFKQLILRHESLKTSFHMINDEPVQKIHDNVKFEIEKLEGRGAPPWSPDIIRNYIRPFDLSKASLLRVGLLKEKGEKGDRHILMIDMHHIISDGTSMNILVKDFIALYQDMGLSELGLQYKDYSSWQNSKKHEESIKQQEHFWINEFAGEIPVLELPTDYLRPVVQNFEGSRIRFEIDKNITDLLKKLTIETDVTLYILLLSMYTVFLSKLTNQEDIVIGSPIAGRRHADLENIIGMFVNTLAFRNYPLGKKTFIGFLQEVKERTLSALENQDYQYEELVEVVALSRDVSRNPLFDTMLVLQNFDTQEIKIPGLKLAPYEYENKTSKFDLTLTGIETQEKLLFIFQYSTKLFKEETINRFIGYFKNIINNVILDKDREISDFEIITEKEKKQILFEFNNTEAEYPKDKTIEQLFAEQVLRTGDHIAIVGFVGEANEEVKKIHSSYRELDSQSNHIANQLKSRHVKPGAIIAIMVEPTLEMVIGIMGILKVGGVFLPIEPGSPIDRVNRILDDSHTGILLTKSQQSPQSQQFHLPISFNTNIEIIHIDRDVKPGESQSIISHTGPADPLYVIYTSGTTGSPKGVLIAHKNIINYVYWFIRTINLSANDRAILTSSFAFDAFYTQFFSSLLTGCELHVIPRETFLFAERLLNYLRQNKITYIKVTPSLFNLIVDNPGFSVENLKELRFVMLGGEAINVQDVEKAHKLCPHVHMMNHYGPTETTIGSIARFLDFTQFEAYKNAPTIGKPLHNTWVYILDKAFKVIPIGVAGGLYIGGDGVGMGYINKPGLTAEKFDQDLWNKIDDHFGEKGGLNSIFSKKASLILYKTGDLARWHEDGNIQFLGRSDDQVKIRGYRIEPGEIENRLLKYNNVKE
ncbi:MAG TPA: amino acid adenylation domain-containing protein, partial [Candidatus Deferrimicrobium sp.]|nr:amino acid adenylation domain-containing protein [Candidatus Deferrimicrobium sp.]